LTVAVTTAIAALISRLAAVPDLEMLYLLATVLVAVRWGRGPAFLCGALGVAAYDFFLVPPFFTFSVADRFYFLTFAMMLGIAFLLSELTSRLRRQQRFAVLREERTTSLYSLSRALGASETLEGAARVTCEHVARLLSAERVALLVADAPQVAGGAAVLGPVPAKLSVLHTLRSMVPSGVAPSGVAGSGDGRGEVADALSPPPPLAESELAVAHWVFSNGKQAGLGTDTLGGAPNLCIPLLVGETPRGVLSLVPRDGGPPSWSERELLESVARQAALALERLQKAQLARDSAIRARSEELRSALLSAVSHDLRTPLGSITGACSMLRTHPDLAAATRAELLDSVWHEAQRLERLVSNLLDITRLESESASPRCVWVPVDEVVGAALSHKEGQLASRPVEVVIEPADCMAWLDPVLFDLLISNLLDNACKYTPLDTPLALRCGVDNGRFELAVLDRGPGLPAGYHARIFEKFERGPLVEGASTPGGAGLGLAICRAVAQAHGGDITARDRPGGGAEFRVELPQPAPAPAGELGEGGPK
jgi:two-component system sensor histidine kinase KdpD